jgi:predicted Zn-dependent protease
VSQSDFVTRGQALVSSGQYQEAVKVCRLGLLGRPTTVEGRVVLGQALLALKRYDEVLAEMRVALELDHTSVAAQVLKGEALLRKGDGHGAVEVLGKLRAEGMADSHAAALLAEAERIAGRSPPMNASHPSIGFLSQDASAFAALDQGTKNYPAYQADDASADLDEDTGGEYTRPTSLAAPGIKKRTAPAPILSADATPSPAILAVGDRSGTVEVDPELEGIDLRGEDDFGEVVGPPVAPGQLPVDDAALRDGPRGSIKASSKATRPPAAAAPAAKKPQRASMFKDEVSTVELDDEAMLEVAETLSPASRAGQAARNLVPGPGTAVRNAVKMPSGPIDLPAPAAMRPTMLPLPAPSPPPHLAQLLASQPHVMNVMPPAALPPQPQVNPRSAIAAALPTAAAVPLPQPAQPVNRMPLPMMPQPPQPAMQPQMQVPVMSQFQQMQQLPAHLSSSVAAARPTIALNPMQQQSAAAVDAIFNAQDAQAPAWARATMLPGGPPPYGAGRAAADEPTRQPHELDPRIAALLAGQGSSGVPATAFAGEASSSTSRSARAGVRKGRSRLQVLLWIMIGAAVIGGGVFAGFQIRSLRLRKQIAAARDRAVALAKADTWQGWLGARESLFSIAQASPTVDNKAALARARAVLAYEFGDGLADARAAIDGLAGQASPDLDLATAYLALAQNDAKIARDVAERARQAAPNDAAALYVSGQAALLAGDARGAVEELRHAFDREARPLYAVGLARALGASSAWDDALAAVDRAADNPAADNPAADNPAAVIAKAVLLAGAGRLSGGPGVEIRAQLSKLIAEGGKSPADQPRRVSPSQVAFAELALAQVDFARNELGAAHTDYRASLDLQLNDQRFAEELIDTVYAIGELETARKAAALALDKWPASRRARTALAQIWLTSGKPASALDLFTRTPDTAGWPKGQTVRGQARLATGDIDGARADFEAALKKLPGYEPALIARAWLDLAAGDVDDARQRVEPRFNPKTATTAMTVVYAAILRATGDPAARDKAKTLLERVVTSAPGPETARAQLELARIDRDLGDLRAARAMYVEASRGGNFDARLENGLVQIEDSDPAGGRETLEQLLKDTGDHPPAGLLLETARARALVGAHAGAAELLALADKTPGVVRWQLDRERGRLALRKNDATGAAQALARALDGCGADPDTFILAADTISTDNKQTALAQKLNALVPTRLKGRPEADIIAGKLDLAAENRLDEAYNAYTAAREGLLKEKASLRRRAQADYGLAAVAYYRRDDPTARSNLELVMIEDPSIFSAYLFAAEIARPKAPKDALKLAQQAAAFNPASLDAWKLVGTLAAQLGNRQLLNDAITRVNDLAPGSETFHQLQNLRP